MDKNEYREIVKQMFAYMDQRDYQRAMELADQVEWKRVKKASTLLTVSEIYEYNQAYEKSREILYIAYDRSPENREIVYRLGILTLKLGNVEEAMDCYEEFVDLAPKDPNRYILRYKILQAQNMPIEERIETLEQFKKLEYIEKWAYELAKLYCEAGRISECLTECDDLILWFSEGKYVYQAMELKMRYKALTPLQKEKYSRRFEPKEEIEEEAPVDLPEDVAEEATERKRSVFSGISQMVSGANLREALENGFAMARSTFGKKELAVEKKEEFLDEQAFGDQELFAEENAESQKCQKESIEKERERIGETEKTEKQRKFVAGKSKGAVQNNIATERVESTMREGEDKQEDIVNIDDILKMWESRQPAELLKGTVLQKRNTKQCEIEKKDEGKSQESMEKTISQTITKEQSKKLQENVEEQVSQEVPAEQSEVLQESVEESILQAVAEEQSEASQASVEVQISQAMPEEESMDIEKAGEKEAEQSYPDSAVQESEQLQLEWEQGVAKEKALGESCSLTEEADVAENLVETKRIDLGEEFEEVDEFQNKIEKVLEEAKEEDFTGEAQEQMDLEELEIEEEIEERMNQSEGGVSFDTGYVIEGRYDLETQSEIGLKAGLTQEQKELFSYFVPVRGMSEQLVTVLENDKNCTDRYGTSRTGNLIIEGYKGSGKTVLAIDVIKVLQKNRNLTKGKVAIVTADALNNKELSQVLEKLFGGALVIEKAADLNTEKIRELNELMEGQTGEMLVVLEEESEPLQTLLEEHPDFAGKFTSRLQLPVFINDELVTFGQTYAKENGYKIDEMGILALYSRIDMLQRDYHAVSVAEVKEIMDEAIENSQKGNVKHLFKRATSRKKDGSPIILHEEDFLANQ